MSNDSRHGKTGAVPSCKNVCSSCVAASPSNMQLVTSSTHGPVLTLSTIDWTKVKTAVLQAHDKIDFDYGFSPEILMTKSVLLERFSMVKNADDMEAFCSWAAKRELLTIEDSIHLMAVYIRSGPVTVRRTLETLRRQSVFYQQKGNYRNRGRDD